MNHYVYQLVYRPRLPLYIALAESRTSGVPMDRLYLGGIFDHAATEFAGAKPLTDQLAQHTTILEEQ